MNPKLREIANSVFHIIVRNREEQKDKDSDTEEKKIKNADRNPNSPYSSIKQKRDNNG